MGRDGWRVDPGFDVDECLAQPLVARIATAGPRVRPVWFLWEDRCFWWLTGSWARLADDLARDSHVELVVDTCDLATGEVLGCAPTARPRSFGVSHPSGSGRATCRSRPGDPVRASSGRSRTAGVQKFGAAQLV
jgi:hypothetical protein